MRTGFWEVIDIVALVETAEAAQNLKRGRYKKVEIAS